MEQELHQDLERSTIPTTSFGELNVKQRCTFITEDPVTGACVMEEVEIEGFVFSVFGASGGGGDVLVQFRKCLSGQAYGGSHYVKYPQFKKRCYTKKYYPKVTESSGLWSWGWN